MAHCLIALGSNLGDSEATLRQAVERINQLPQTVVCAQSRWHDTNPVGGPPQQRNYLNGAVLCSTQLTPLVLFTHLREIEGLAGRQRQNRWDSRTLDLDLLLWDECQQKLNDLCIPHPRMICRPFVLNPAADVAPGMRHPEANWTVERLANNLRSGPPYVAIAAACQETARALGRRLQQRVGEQLGETPGVAPPAEEGDWPRLVIGILPASTCAVGELLGVEAAQRRSAESEASAGSRNDVHPRKILGLPASGGVLWIGDPPETAIEDALGAVEGLGAGVQENLGGGISRGLTRWEVWRRAPASSSDPRGPF